MLSQGPENSESGIIPSDTPQHTAYRVAGWTAVAVYGTAMPAYLRNR